jgi:DNA polymerase III alpha subunit
VLHAPSAVKALFDADPGSVARTREVAERCRFGLGELRYVYPSERLPDGTTSADWLRQLTYEGARRRYGERVPQKARQPSVDRADLEACALPALRPRIVRTFEAENADRAVEELLPRWLDTARRRAK